MMLDSMAAKMPKLATFFVTVYRSEQSDVQPFGVARINILNNGDVGVKLMGLGTSDEFHATKPYDDGI